MTIEKILETLYPDVTPENMDKITPERVRQYNRDKQTITENFDKLFYHLGQDVTSGQVELTARQINLALHYIHYENYHEKLFPGYKELSVPRQEALEMRAGLATDLRKLDFIFSEFSNPDSPLYQTGYTEPQLIEIASNYVSALEASDRPIKYQTGRMQHVLGGDWYDAEPEYATRAPNGYERTKQLEEAVKSFQKKEKAKIFLSSIIGKTKEYSITTEKVVQAYHLIEKSRTIADKSQETEINQEAEVDFE